jgi:hypothetical protein
MREETFALLYMLVQLSAVEVRVGRWVTQQLKSLKAVQRVKPAWLMRVSQTKESQSQMRAFL